MSSTHTSQSTIEKQDRLKGYLLTAPAVILLLIFTVYPLGYLVYRSLYGGSLITKTPKFVGMKNYRILINSKDFHRVLSNTLIYTLITVVFTMVLAILIAVWLNSKRNRKLNETVQTFIFTPHIISMVSVSTLFLWLMDSKYGLFNVILKALGLPTSTFLASPDTALFSLALVQVWKGLGYYVLLIMAALQNECDDRRRSAELYQYAGLLHL